MVKQTISKETKRVDSSLKTKKAPTKSELELQVEDLLQANDALEQSNRKKIELIKSFEGKIDNLQKQINSLSCKEIMLCQETQTEAVGLDTKCDECNFEAENERELGWHKGRNHGWPSEEKGQSLYDLDAHTWDIHDKSIE